MNKVQLYSAGIHISTSKGRAVAEGHHDVSFEAAVAVVVRSVWTAWLLLCFLPRNGEPGLDADNRVLPAPWLTMAWRREEDGEGGEDEDEVGDREDEVGEEEGEDDE